jgi:hypothetical protein
MLLEKFLLEGKRSSCNQNALGISIASMHTGAAEMCRNVCYGAMGHVIQNETDLDECRIIVVGGNSLSTR